jgi:hypothetical protein
MAAYISNLFTMGDGNCDWKNNNIFGNWDGGDCCCVACLAEASSSDTCYEAGGCRRVVLSRCFLRLRVNKEEMKRREEIENACCPDSQRLRRLHRAACGPAAGV